MWTRVPGQTVSHLHVCDTKGTLALSVHSMTFPIVIVLNAALDLASQNTPLTLCMFYHWWSQINFNENGSLSPFSWCCPWIWKIHFWLLAYSYLLSTPYWLKFSSVRMPFSMLLNARLNVASHNMSLTVVLSLSSFTKDWMRSPPCMCRV